MKEIDTIYLEDPCMGSRRYAKELCRRGWTVGRKLIRRLLRVMGIEAVYQRPRTSIPNKVHLQSPYLLKGLDIQRPNQVWVSDITYVPMPHGFIYLTVIMDWYSRKILTWRLSNTMDADFCVEALEEALARYGTPEIFNTDQGSQYTSEQFQSVLAKTKCQVSMDGKGRYMDNIMNERFWRTLKYEHVYLIRPGSVQELRMGLLRWINYYNSRRLHQNLDYMTPDEIYFNLSVGESLPDTISQESYLIS